MTKKIIISLALLGCVTKLFAQHERLDAISDSITAEGKALYRSEWTSWYGTDIFVAKCPHQKGLAGGYLSYETNDGLTNIFFSKGDDPSVLTPISFAKDFNSNNYKLDSTVRKFTRQENELYLIRTAAIKRTSNDTTFKRYKNTSLNFVPIIQNGEKKVYILTGPQIDNMVIFGNDYLVNFNSANEITSFKHLHKGLIPISTKADSGKTVEESIHTHLPEYSEFITATDICTLMLYEKFTTWKQHEVISKNYISIWDCQKNRLYIMTMEVWKKIEADSEKRHPKKE